jgi:hypothetical protein
VFSKARRLLTPGWLLGHALVWLAVAVCLALGWWQAGRAAGGNTLSWAYTFEWPLFAIFAIVLWVREMRATLRAGKPGESPPPKAEMPRRGPVITRREANLDDGDAEYNRYLASLNAMDKEAR